MKRTWISSTTTPFFIKMTFSLKAKLFKAVMRGKVHFSVSFKLSWISWFIIKKITYGFVLSFCRHSLLSVWRRPWLFWWLLLWLLLSLLLPWLLLVKSWWPKFISPHSWQHWWRRSIQHWWSNIWTGMGLIVIYFCRLVIYFSSISILKKIAIYRSGVQFTKTFHYFLIL